MNAGGILHAACMMHGSYMVLIGLGTRCLYARPYYNSKLMLMLMLIQDRVQGTSTSKSMHACLCLYYDYGMMLCINVVITTGTFTFIYILRQYCNLSWTKPTLQLHYITITITWHGN